MYRIAYHHEISKKEAIFQTVFWTQYATFMTLKPYTPEMLDDFALRMLDLAALLRAMASRSREHGIAGLTIHDKKAREWYTNLDRWARKSHAELEMRIIEARAERRAGSLPE